jgi:hypothetical protein
LIHLSLSQLYFLGLNEAGRFSWRSTDNIDGA